MRIHMRLDPATAQHALWGLVMANLHQIRTTCAEQGWCPSVIYAINAGHIRYVRKDKGEHWKTFGELFTDGWGDCEDLACAVVAELIAQGWDARPFVYVSDSKRGTHHVVLHAMGVGLLDPSLAAGMP